MIDISLILEECDPEEIVEQMNLENPEYEYGECAKFLKLDIEKYFLPRIRKYCLEFE
jgi:hypothetical protein